MVGRIVYVSVQIGVNESDTFTHASSQDIISAYKESDKIVAATDVHFAGANVAGKNGVALAFSDGSFLTVAGDVDATFILADGSSYKADQESGTFVDA